MGVSLPSKLVNFWSNSAQNWVNFSRNFSRRISREKCLAKSFLVLARNARNVQVYITCKSLSNGTMEDLSLQPIFLCDTSYNNYSSFNSRNWFFQSSTFSQ